MAYDDILLQIDTYPDATSAAAIQGAVDFARLIGGAVTALAVEIDIRAPRSQIAEYLIELSSLAEAEEHKSRAAARQALETFTAAAKAAGVFGGALTARAELYAVADVVAQRARTRDLCLIALGEAFDDQRAIAETVVFDSGRPVLAFQPGQADLPKALTHVVVAWDGGRCAARAVSDAMPLLQAAAEVTVLTVTEEKPSARAGVGEDVVRHLKAHGVKAAAVEVDVAGRKIGAALDSYLLAEGADLLVMGAYGHSRMREFVVGGATRHVLHRPPKALFLSH